MTTLSEPRKTDIKRLFRRYLPTYIIRGTYINQSTKVGTVPPVKPSGQNVRQRERSARTVDVRWSLLRKKATFLKCRNMRIAC